MYVYMYVEDLMKNHYQSKYVFYYYQKMFDFLCELFKTRMKNQIIILKKIQLIWN